MTCPGKPGHGSRFVQDTAAEKLVNNFLLWNFGPSLGNLKKAKHGKAKLGSYQCQSGTGLFIPRAQFTQDAEAHLRANLQANPLILLAMLCEH